MGTIVEENGCLYQTCVSGTIGIEQFITNHNSVITRKLLLVTLRDQLSELPVIQLG